MSNSLSSSQLESTEKLTWTSPSRRYATHYVSPLDAVVILDGAPVVGADRADRLLQAIIKATQREAGLRIARSDIEMPTDEAGQGKGFMFVTLANPAEAQQFQRTMHEHSFDKKHTFRVIPFSEVDRYDGLQEMWVEPQEEDWAPKVSSASVES